MLYLTLSRVRYNIMRFETFASGAIARLLQRRTIATMDELKEALGSSVNMTVFRKLRELSYLTSYSHRGKYYALEETAQFDERGLWAFRGVRFSRFGSLVNTLESFVARATGGYLASELSSELGVEVKQSLLGLTRGGQLVREEIAGLYLYCSADKLDGASSCLPASSLPPRNPRSLRCASPTPNPTKPRPPSSFS